MYARVNTHYEIGLQEIGEQMVQDAFRSAAKAFLYATTTLWMAEEISSSVAFVNGSGLETVIRTFGLNLDADTLRETFQWKLRHCRS